VLRLERFAVVLVRNPRLAAGEIVEGSVGRVAAVAKREDVLRVLSTGSSRASSETPVQDVSSFDHFVVERILAWVGVRECFLSVATSATSLARPPSQRPLA
jgi:hypothetical protein